LKKSCYSYFLLIAFQLIYKGNLFSQVNFVYNGDFETKTTCNIGPGAINIAPNWVQPTFGTSDYFNVCAGLGSQLGVPLNLFGFQNAHSGAGYSGIFVYLTSPIDTNYREFIQTKLKEILKAQSIYYLEFYINLSDIPQIKSNKVAINSFGCYFSDSAFFDSTFTNAPRIPQIQTSNTMIYADTAGWMKIQGIYKAKGGEEYITLGNFKDDASTLTQIVATSTVLPISAQISYYYIDDVSLFEITTPKTIHDTTICLGDSLLLGANDTAISCVWYPKIGLNDSTLTNPTAIPKLTTKYYVSHQNTFGYTATDSVLITVIDCSSESSLWVPNIFSPNQDNQNDLFSITSKNIVHLNCKIVNRYGALVAEINELNQSWDGRSNSGKELSDGVYYYYLNAIGRDLKKYELKGFVQLVR
jgi:gliding motility-associated-like protein